MEAFSFNSCLVAGEFPVRHRRTIKRQAVSFNFFLFSWVEATRCSSDYKTRGLLAKTARILTSYFSVGQVKDGPKGGGRPFPYRLLRRPFVRVGTGGLPAGSSRRRRALAPSCRSAAAGQILRTPPANPGRRAANCLAGCRILPPNVFTGSAFACPRGNFQHGTSKE